MPSVDKEKLMEDALRYYSQGKRDINYTLNHLMDDGHDDQALNYVESELKKLEKPGLRKWVVRLITALLLGLCIGTVVSFFFEEPILGMNTLVFGGMAAFVTFLVLALDERFIVGMKFRRHR